MMHDQQNIKNQVMQFYAIQFETWMNTAAFITAFKTVTVS
jgi:hypothetical protein